MKISHRWLLEYISTDGNPVPDEISEMLTACGLEVEAMEEFSPIKGGLEGLIVGEIVEKDKHPGADRLSLTKVNTGGENLLSIVCGAPNVEKGQKVIIAPVGSTIFPKDSEPVTIKKSKIRGELSEGMICAEDEVGLGESHQGILILDPSAVVGTAVKDHLKISTDVIYEIGLTPNRADAASHFGVARDLVSVINCRHRQKRISYSAKLKSPDVSVFNAARSFIAPFSVEVPNPQKCRRYSGILIDELNVSASPQWLQTKLRSIGVKPINSIVDVTNFVLHETGQPLHAFDASKISGNKIVVKTLTEATPFTTLDGVERKLTSEDLMICDAEKPMCIAGVYGGINTGVTTETTAVFIESACFDPATIRFTSKHHQLKTDAAFRFERGTDPEITVSALKRAVLLIQEIAKGRILTPVIDVNFTKSERKRISYDLSYSTRITGTNIPADFATTIFADLGFTTFPASPTKLDVEVPGFKIDVTRAVDLAEELLRIYGYDQIPLPGSLKVPVINGIKEKPLLENKVADYLSSNGFNEVFTSSFVGSEEIKKTGYATNEKLVKILNPHSNELNCLRPALLFAALPVVAHNLNRQQKEIKVYTSGREYIKENNSYSETQKLLMLVTGNFFPASWKWKSEETTLFHLKGTLINALLKCGVDYEKLTEEISTINYADDFGVLKFNNKETGSFGEVKKSFLNYFEIKEKVFFADLNLSEIQKIQAITEYKEVSKFPTVFRDLSMILDKQVQYRQIKNLVQLSENEILESVTLFDVYEGEKIGEGKKSYAITIAFNDPDKTLTEGRIDKAMSKIMNELEKNLGAVIRKE